MMQFNRRGIWLWITGLVVLVATALQLRNQGRFWWCTCNEFYLWSGEVWSRHNSQHLFDPYSFTHILHGFMFCGLLALILPKAQLYLRLLLSIILEAIWEIIENSEFVINRYREATAALGYTGDTVANALGDILCCAVGFMLAQGLGLRRSLLVFVLMEIVLMLWIRDSLVLNIIMLIYPIDAIKDWQMG